MHLRNYIYLLLFAFYIFAHRIVISNLLINVLRKRIISPNATPIIPTMIELYNYVGR